MRSLLMLAVVACTPLVLHAAELVPHGNMEQPFVHGLPPGWVRNCWGKSEVSTSPGKPHAGAASFKIECKSFDSGAVQFYHPLRVQRGKRYTLSLWMRAIGPTCTVSAGLRHCPEPYTMHLSTEFEIGEDWERYTFTGTSSSTDDNAALFIWYRPDGAATLWVDDVSVTETEHRPVDLPLPAGNVLPNASFELPLSRDWRSRPVAPVFDTQRPFHGTRALRWDLDGEADQLAARLLEFGGRGMPFTLALAARAKGKATVVAELWPAVRATASKPLLRLVAPPTDAWQVFRTTAALPSSSNGAYYFLFDVRPQGKATVWVDAVRLEPGDGKMPFRCRRPVEVALSCTKLAHIHRQGDAVALAVEAFNDTPAAQTVSLTCETSDYWRRPTASNDAKLAVPPGSRARAVIRPSVAKCGAYLAELRHGGAVQSALSFCVLPKLSDVPPERSAVGGHFKLDKFHLAVANRMGIKWTRIHDCESITHWNTVEPERGRLVWHDDKVALARKHGVCILGEFLRVPKWASSAGPDVKGHDVHQCPPRSLDEFAAYARAVVGHYKGDIHHWEVWNEPYHSGFWRGTPEQFAELAKVAARATRSADPAARIVGPCAAPSTHEWLEKAMAAGVLDASDIFSYHGYGTFRTSAYRLVQRWAAHGRATRRPIWNTETGPTSRSFFRHLPDKLVSRYANWLRPLDCDVAAEHAVKLFVLALAGGAERYFQYWCVYEDGLLPRLSAMSIFEYDGSLRPMGVAYAVAASLLDGTRGEGWLELPGPALASLLHDDARFIAVLWRRGGRRPRRLRLHALPPSLVVRNLMGNRVALARGADGHTIAVRGEPLYLIVPLAERSALLSALRRVSAQR
ncbi:carbohydrate binding domain-containing protein [bacterium]|nr:carbohydrate binding domain-containing protein [bacterium]